MTLNEQLNTQETESPKNHPSNLSKRTNHYDLDALFTFQPATEGQRVSYLEIREAARGFAGVVLLHCPACADTTAAIRKIREAVMTANAAIALDPR